jgi:hypothetical protein
MGSACAGAENLTGLPLVRSYNASEILSIERGVRGGRLLALCWKIFSFQIGPPTVDRGLSEIFLRFSDAPSIRCRVIDPAEFSVGKVDTKTDTKRAGIGWFW